MINPAVAHRRLLGFCLVFLLLKWSNSAGVFHFVTDFPLVAITSVRYEMSLMKPHLSSTGILRWSTTMLALSLVSCDSNVKRVMADPPAEDQAPSAVTQPELSKEESEKLKALAAFDQRKAVFESGKIENNFYLEKLGYYHANAHRFFPHAYQEEKEGKWYVDGEWRDERGAEAVEPTTPNVETLAALEKLLVEQPVSANGTASSSGSASPPMGMHHNGFFGGHFGWSDALLTYMVLSGNRHQYTPMQPGILSQRGSFMQQQMSASREEINRRASSPAGFNSGAGVGRASSSAVSHPSYDHLSNKTAGTSGISRPNSAGATIRGAFGSSSRSSSSS